MKGKSTVDTEIMIGAQDRGTNKIDQDPETDF